MSFGGIIVSVISAAYYLKIVKLLFLPEGKLAYGISSSSKDTNIENKQKVSLIPNETFISEEKVDISNIQSFIISTLTLVILLFVFKPSLILNSTQLLALSLFNY